MTNQEVFNTIAEHLRTQKGQSLDAQGRCSYRGLNGKKCAVGVLIPDYAYTSGIEGSAVRMLSSARFPFPVDRNLLRALQMAHDDCLNWDGDDFNNNGEHELQGIAESFGLIYVPKN